MALIGNPKPSKEQLKAMRADNYSFSRWWVYQNQEDGHPDRGNVEYLQCGRHNKHIAPPAQIPDPTDGVNWRYVLAGYVDLREGTIAEASMKPAKEKGGNTHLGYAKPDDPIYRLGPVVAGRPIFAGPPEKKGGQK